MCVLAKKKEAKLEFWMVLLNAQFVEAGFPVNSKGV